MILAPPQFNFVDLLGDADVPIDEQCSFCESRAFRYIGWYMVCPRHETYAVQTLASAGYVSVAVKAYPSGRYLYQLKLGN